MFRNMATHLKKILGLSLNSEPAEHPAKKRRLNPRPSKFAQIPPEILIECFKYLKPDSLSKCQLVNKPWRKLLLTHALNFFPLQQNFWERPFPKITPPKIPTLSQIRPLPQTSPPFLPSLLQTTFVTIDSFNPAYNSRRPHRLRLPRKTPTHNLEMVYLPSYFDQWFFKRLWQTPHTYHLLFALNTFAKYIPASQHITTHFLPHQSCTLKAAKNSLLSVTAEITLHEVNMLVYNLAILAKNSEILLYTHDILTLPQLVGIRSLPEIILCPFSILPPTIGIMLQHHFPLANHLPLAHNNFLLNIPQLTLENIREIFTQILYTIYQLHLRGIVHGDLDETKILLADDLKTLEIGGIHSFQPQDRSKMTIYIPEYNQDSWNTTRTTADDLYSCGILLYKLLNQPQYKPFSEIDPLTEDSEENIRENCKQNAAYPAVLDLLQHLLASNPAQRPSAAAALAHPFIQRRDLLITDPQQKPAVCPFAWQLTPPLTAAEAQDERQIPHILQRANDLLNEIIEIMQKQNKYFT